MDGASATTGSGGVNQSGVRDHNERLLLTMLHRQGPTPGSDLARQAGLSPQTVSVILRRLERDGILKRGAPVRGKVGKPSTPMSLNPDGILSVGMKLGRRSADLLLLDVLGTVRKQLQITYDFPLPTQIFAFLETGLPQLQADLSPGQRRRICGIGIGMPFELWKWPAASGPQATDYQSWANTDFVAEIARFSDLPVFLVNDATAACRAEHLHGRGSEFQNYAYFFVGSFVGGGVVLNGSVYEGNQGNAGALGSMRSTGPLGESRQLIDVASLHLLESRLLQAGLDAQMLYRNPDDWSDIMRYVDPWIGEAAQELAKASLSICSVIDFEAVLIDGAFPAAVRSELVERVKRYLVNQDMRGLIPPRIECGEVGPNARTCGAASSPIVSQFLQNRDFGGAST